MITDHKILIEDKARCESYQKAIHQVVKRGDAVVDIGTGSGLLAFFALQAGASKVYAIERRDIIEDAKEIAKANNFSKKIVFIKRVSTEVNLSERVDVVVSEIIGHFGIDEGILKYFNDAKRRFLKEGGRIIPSYLEIIIAPVEAPDIYKKEIEFWNKNSYGINFSKFRHKAINSCFVQLIKPEGILAESVKLGSIDFYQLNEPKRVYIDNKVMFKIRRKGVLHGLCGWFEARLAKGILLSNSPHNRLSSWKNYFFPIETPVSVNKGDIVCVTMNAQSFFKNILWDWTVEIEKRFKNKKVKQIKFHHSTFKSLTITGDWILRLSRNFTPILEQEDKIRLFILTCCNGENSTEEIARKLIKKFPTSFGSINEALDRVLKVTERCEVAPPKEAKLQTVSNPKQKLFPI
jgi:protein arginine N-methyltransferase 1